jgi:hypothetical protein
MTDEEKQEQQEKLEEVHEWNLVQLFL